MFKKSDVKVGTEISCTVSGQVAVSAKIQIEDGRVFVCQDVIEGNFCQDKLGYRFSWSVANIDRLRETSVDDFFATTSVRNINLKIQPEWDEEVNV